MDCCEEIIGRNMEIKGHSGEDRPLENEQNVISVTQWQKNLA